VYDTLLERTIDAEADAIVVPARRIAG